MDTGEKVSISFEDKKESRAEKRGQCPEAGKAKGIDSPLEPPNEFSPTNILI